MRQDPVARPPASRPRSGFWTKRFQDDKTHNNDDDLRHVTFANGEAHSNSASGSGKRTMRQDPISGKYEEGA